MAQEVILLSDVPGLGQIGEQKKVKDGYARNFLVPKKLAVYATVNSVNRAERQKGKIAALREKHLAQAQTVSEKLSKVGLVFERFVGQGGKLYGSVTPLDIAEELARQGATVEKRSILMHGPIKALGDHIVRVRVHSKVVVDIPVKVIGQVKKEDQKITEGQVEGQAEGNAEVQAEAPATQETQDKAPSQEESK